MNHVGPSVFESIDQHEVVHTLVQGIKKHQNFMAKVYQRERRDETHDLPSDNQRLSMLAPRMETGNPQ